MPYDLFDPDLERRYQSVCTLEADGKRVTYDWPKGCWGAANGWLMLVGPSPGKDPDWEDKPREPMRPLQQVYVGRHQGKIEFPNGSKARNTRWNKFTRSLFGGNESYANALTCVANLDWVHHGPEKKAKVYSEGCHCVWEVVQKAKPRVVVALTNAVWDVFCSEIQNPAVPEVVVPSQLTRKPIVFQISGYGAPSIFLKAPQHPSWPLRAEYYVWMYETVNNFLKELGNASTEKDRTTEVCLA